MCTPLKSQYETSDDRKARNQQYEQGLNDNYRRWTKEDLQRTGQMDRINERVAEAEAAFNKERDAQIAKLTPKAPQPVKSPFGVMPGRANTGTAPARAPQPTPQQAMMIKNLQRQQFNADQMRRDLMREASLKRVESGVYSRQNITADSAPSQVSVIGGASGRRPRGSTSGGARGGNGTPTTGSTGVKLNIGT